MKKHIFFIAGIIVFLSLQTLNAQNPWRQNRNVKYKISGQIKDSKTKESIPYCPVIVLNKKDTIETYSLSDKKGFFSIPLHPGQYRLVLRFMGYKTDTLKISVKDKDIFIGVLKLNPATNTLKTVTVKESSVNNLVDKDEIVVTEKLKTGAATTTDVLDKVNGVSYDRYDDHIEVDNSEDVLFMVNGLEKDQEYIKNMDPDRIEKIEIIRDPGGRYGLEGYTAILNVILKKNYVGQELAIGSMGTIDLDAQDKDYLTPMLGGRITYNYTQDKYSYYIQARGFKMNAGMFTTTLKDMDSTLILQEPLSNDHYNSVYRMQILRLSTGLDYLFNPKNTLSGEVSFNMTPPMNTFGYYKLNTIYNDSILSTQDFYNDVYTSSKGGGIKLFYVGKYSANDEIHSDIRLNTNNSSSETSIKYVPGFAQTTKVEGNENSLEYNIDWTHNLSDKIGMQIGYGNVFRDIKSSTYSDILQKTNSSDYLDIRNRAFAYGTFAISSQITLKTGLAYELSTPKVADTTYTFSVLQPYIDMQYKPNKMFNIKLKYRVRSKYPTVNQVNPYEVRLDNERIRVGNQHLKPTYINMLSLKFNLFGGMMYLEGYYKFSNGYIAEILTKRNDGTLVYTYDNIGLFQEKGIKTSFTIPLWKTIMWQNNLRIFNTSMSYGDYTNSFNDWGGRSNLMYADRKHNMMIGLMYTRQMFKRINLQGYSMRRNNFWGFMIQKSFLKKKLNIMAFYLLPLDLWINYERKSYTKTDFYTQTDISDASAIKNVFFFRLSYRISKGKIVRPKNIGNEDNNQEDNGFNLF